MRLIRDMVSDLEAAPLKIMFDLPGYVFSNVDFHQYSSKTQFTDAIGAAHGMMNTTGYAGLPGWMSEWGSYDFDLPNVRQNNSVPFAIKMINNW